MESHTVKRTDLLRASPPMFKSPLAGRPLARPPGGARAALRAGDPARVRNRGRPAGPGRRAGRRAGRLRGLDADRVLAAPPGLPLRARGRPRGAAALDHPRRPPRPSQRPDAAGHAAVGQRAAGPGFLGLFVAGRRRGVGGGRRSAASSPATWPTTCSTSTPTTTSPQTRAGAPAARAAHAPPLPGRHGAGYGVSAPYWDRVFGTAPDPAAPREVGPSPLASRVCARRPLAGTLKYTAAGRAFGVTYPRAARPVGRDASERNPQACLAARSSFTRGRASVFPGLAAQGIVTGRRRNRRRP